MCRIKHSTSPVCEINDRADAITSKKSEPRSGEDFIRVIASARSFISHTGRVLGFIQYIPRFSFEQTLKLPKIYVQKTLKNLRFFTQKTFM